MAGEISTINLSGVNAYLLAAEDGVVLFDTGTASKRASLQQALASAGCRPGNLKLAILSHGDVDHAGNAAWLRAEYATRIAMGCDDAGMVERGDMNWNRKARPDRTSLLGRLIMPLSKVMTLFSGPERFETFAPDLCLEDGQDLGAYGLEARVLHLPGHSRGSIGILTADGALLCGDLVPHVAGDEVLSPIVQCGDHLRGILEIRAGEVQSFFNHTLVDRGNREEPAQVGPRSTGLLGGPALRDQAVQRRDHMGGHGALDPAGLDAGQDRSRGGVVGLAPL